MIPDEPEYWRVMATNEDTRVSPTCRRPTIASPCSAASRMLIEAERDFTITANAPIAVAQVPGSQRTTGIPSTLPGGERPPGGDPSLILLPPIEQWRSHYLFLVPNKYAFDFLLLAIPMGTELLYDGLPIHEVILGCEYEIVGSLGRARSRRVPGHALPALGSPSGRRGLSRRRRPHPRSCWRRPFGLVVWGWDSFVSYGYPGGANLGLINLL